MINEKVSPRSGGIQRLCTLNGLILHGPDELEDYQFYVGCGNETFKYLPYWEHPKVPQYIRRNYPSSHEPPEKPPSKKLLIEPSQLQPPIHLLKGEGDRPSVYHAKPEKASRETTPRSLSPDHEPSVYKAQQPPEEIKGAQMIQEDKDIQVEMPVDQVPAEVVQEEDIYSNVGDVDEQPSEENKESLYEEGERQEVEAEEEPVQKEEEPVQKEEEPVQKTVSVILRHFNI
nr:PREDICTED: doublecortin domain-containing protein 2C [Anolis carolinensis]|eukprot:XP_008120859.1 PREDICTED: doublecortin domain-containing protein 2C [Anolis carolinensis]